MELSKLPPELELVIIIPVAGFQADGTTRFTVVEATLGETYQNLHSALAKEKQKADGAIDELIKNMPVIVKETRKNLEQILPDEKNDEQPKK